MSNHNMFPTVPDEINGGCRMAVPNDTGSHGQYAAALAAKDAEIAALRERCERLVEEVEASRAYYAWFPIRDRIDPKRQRLETARGQVNLHNDLQPPAGKESSDG